MALVRKLNEIDLLVRSSRRGEHPMADAILDDENCQEAKWHRKGLEIRESKLRRNYIEACLLGSNDFAKIGELLELEPEFIEFFEKVFYNVSGLDRLERLELLDGETDSLKLWAISQGLDFIAWRLGKPVSISPIEGLKDLFNTCVYKSKEAVFNKNASEASKESVKWVKLSIDIARLLKIWVMDSAAAKKDLELALEKVIPDFGDIEDLDLQLELVQQEFAALEEKEQDE